MMLSAASVATARLRDDDRHRFAHEAHDLGGEHRPPHVLVHHREAGWERPDVEIGRRVDGHDARQTTRLGDIDTDDAGMRFDGPGERGVVRAGQFCIPEAVDERRPAKEQRRVLAAPNQGVYGGGQGWIFFRSLSMATYCSILRARVSGRLAS